MHLSASGLARQDPQAGAAVTRCASCLAAVTSAPSRSPVLRGRPLPKNIELIPGPGCPVCVCPEEDVYDAMQLALEEAVTPVVLRRHVARAGERAQGRGAFAGRSQGRRRGCAADCHRRAKRCVSREDNPARTVVFFAAGFETTTAPVAGCSRWPFRDNCCSCCPAAAPGRPSRCRSTRASRGSKPADHAWSRRDRDGLEGVEVRAG